MILDPDTYHYDWTIDHIIPQIQDMSYYDISSLIELVIDNNYYSNFYVFTELELRYLKIIREFK
jgi:hypothetical protein